MSKRSFQLTVLAESLVFMQKHWIVLASLGLLAGLGRVAQLGGFGELSGMMTNALEVVVEGARVAVFLFILGSSSFARGLTVLLDVFRTEGTLKNGLAHTWAKIKTQWLSIGLNLIGFSLIAAAVNLAIDQLAYETCLLLSLKSKGLLATGASEWTILLFFKNILVIPFTVVFETLFILWIARANSVNPSQQ